MNKVTRKSILSGAEQCVCRDREQQYGTPERNFETIAELWDVYIGGKGWTIVDENRVPQFITAHDVGMMQALVKVARIASGQTKEDNYIDLAGYAACAGEIACGE